MLGTSLPHGSHQATFVLLLWYPGSGMQSLLPFSGEIPPPISDRRMMRFMVGISDPRTVSTADISRSGSHQVQEDVEKSSAERSSTHSHTASPTSPIRDLWWTKLVLAAGCPRISSKSSIPDCFAIVFLRPSFPHDLAVCIELATTLSRKGERTTSV